MNRIQETMTLTDGSQVEVTWTPDAYASMPVYARGLGMVAETYAIVRHGRYVRSPEQWNGVKVHSDEEQRRAVIRAIEYAREVQSL